MYLTRLALDIRRRETMRALYAPNLLHGAIEDAFPGARARRLWRIDVLGGATYLLLLSEDAPDLTSVQRQFGFDDQPWMTKDYQPLLDRIQTGTRWQFRLACNPTRSAPAQADGRRGRVEAIAIIPLQRKWLEEQGRKHGFCVEEGAFDVRSSEWRKFKKGRENGREVTLLQTTFEGMLTVTDREAFLKALCGGIGRGKAYGMGLMTVMRNA